MKNKICLLVLIVFCFQTLTYAQVQMNSTARLFQRELALAMNNEKLFKQLVEDYDLFHINGAYHIGVLAIVNDNHVDKEQLRSLNILNDTRLEQLWSMRVPIHHFSKLAQISGIKYIEVGEPVSPDLRLAVPSARVDSVNAGLGGLMQGYRGKGVIIGIIDWGFDYTHPNFYDTTLTDLRISRAWDQNKLSGPPPAGYSFGTEFVGKDNLLAAGSDTLYVFGPSSHGTHVAGIAGGSGAGTLHRGAAHESELIFISLRRDAPSLIDAFSYIANYAASVNKPFVVNMSFGSHLGPHDGTSLKNLGIDILHGPGKIFVGSAGNNGTVITGGLSTFHLDKDFNDTPGDTLKTVVNFVNINDIFGQTLSMWGSENSDFSVALRLVDNSDSTLYQTPFYHSLNEPFINDTILVGNDSLIVRIQSTARHFLNDKPNIRLEVKKTGSNKLVLLATSENCLLHIWNNVRMNNRYTNWGVSLSANYPGATGGNHHYGLGEPAGVGRNVITTASYRAEFVHTNDIVYFGNISSFSSYGPTVDGRTKPDIASTGQSVVSSVNSFDWSVNPGDVNQTVHFNGRDYDFVAYSGTSMSAPMVTGIVALMLEAYPTMSATQAKDILKMTARLDQNTGQIGPEGHLQWGWGKANALAAVLAAETLSNVKNIKLDENLFSLYPNPASSSLNIKMSDYNSTVKEIAIYDMEGKIVKTVSGALDTKTYQLDVSSLSSGFYLVRIQTDTAFFVERLVVSN